MDETTFLRELQQVKAQVDMIAQRQRMSMTDNAKNSPPRAPLPPPRNLALPVHLQAYPRPTIADVRADAAKRASATKDQLSDPKGGIPGLLSRVSQVESKLAEIQSTPPILTPPESIVVEKEPSQKVERYEVPMFDPEPRTGYDDDGLSHRDSADVYVFTKKLRRAAINKRITDVEQFLSGIALTWWQLGLNDSGRHYLERDDGELDLDAFCREIQIAFGGTEDLIAQMSQYRYTAADALKRRNLISWYAAPILTRARQMKDCSEKHQMSMAKQIIRQNISCAMPVQGWNAPERNTETLSGYFAFLRHVQKVIFDRYRHGDHFDTMSYPTYHQPPPCASQFPRMDNPLPSFHQAIPAMPPPMPPMAGPLDIDQLSGPPKGKKNKATINKAGPNRDPMLPLPPLPSVASSHPFPAAFDDAPVPKQLIPGPPPYSGSSPSTKKDKFKMTIAELAKHSKQHRANRDVASLDQKKDELKSTFLDLVSELAHDQDHVRNKSQPSSLRQRKEDIQAELADMLSELVTSTSDEQADRPLAKTSLAKGKETAAINDGDATPPMPAGQLPYVPFVDEFFAGPRIPAKQPKKAAKVIPSIDPEFEKFLTGSGSGQAINSVPSKSPKLKQPGQPVENQFDDALWIGQGPPKKKGVNAFEALPKVTAGWPSDNIELYGAQAPSVLDQARSYRAPQVSDDWEDDIDYKSVSTVAADGSSDIEHD